MDRYPLLLDYPPEQRSRVERLKAQVELLLAQVTVDYRFSWNRPSFPAPALGNSVCADLIPVGIYDKYSVGPSIQPICTRWCFSMTNMIQVCGNFLWALVLIINTRSDEILHCTFSTGIGLEKTGRNHSIQILTDPKNRHVQSNAVTCGIQSGVRLWD